MAQIAHDLALSLINLAIHHAMHHHSASEGKIPRKLVHVLPTMPLYVKYGSNCTRLGSIAPPKARFPATGRGAPWIRVPEKKPLPNTTLNRKPHLSEQITMLPIFTIMVQLIYTRLIKLGMEHSMMKFPNLEFLRITFITSLKSQRPVNWAFI